MKSENLTLIGKWTLSTTGVAIVLYCLLILGFVVTSPDIGLRLLMVDEDELSANLAGPEIKIVTKAMLTRGIAPRAGDVLLSIRRKPVGTFMHFTRALID